MANDADTEDQASKDQIAGGPGRPEPGILLVYSAGAPRLETLLLENGSLDLGRGRIGSAGGVTLDDPVTSRTHARITLTSAGWTVRDLGSRNGTAVDGVTIDGEYTGVKPRVVRVGDSLFVLSPDIRKFRGAAIEVNERMVMGPTLGEAWAALGRAATTGGTLHLRGESGTGKELAAEAFHRLGAHASGPFVAVNCAAIPDGVAERLLFGARRGAYSGAAADADGYIQAAHGGTLFLDEVAELSLNVQAKLLRVLENREVMALGASRSRSVDVGVVTASHKNLRAEVARGSFREDLYFRIARPEVSLPPLRDRPCEVPWLVERALRSGPAPLVGHVSLVEECLLRPWPGNLRELHAELRAAAEKARAEEGDVVEARHLDANAGLRFEAGAKQPPAPISTSPSTLNQSEIEAALRQSDGNISAAARALGLHRTQLRRLLVKYRAD